MGCGASVTDWRQHKQALVAAASTGNVAEVRRLLSVRRFQVRPENYCEFLRAAAANGHLSVLDLLLPKTRGHLFIFTAFEKRRAISKAVSNHNIAVIDRFLAEDSAFYSSALEAAARYGDLAMVDYLLARSPSKNSDNTNVAAHNSALVHASTSGHLIVLDRLLSLPGADATVQNNDAFFEAACNGHVSVVDRLLAVPGVDATADDNCAFLAAARNGRVEVMERLLAVPRVAATAPYQRALLQAVEEHDGNLCLSLRGPIDTNASRYVSVVTRLLAVEGIDTTPVVPVAVGRGTWYLVETLLTHPTAAVALSIEPNTILSPLTRHLTSIELCRHHLRSGVQGPLIWGYRLGYILVREGFPVAVCELMCDYMVVSRGLVMWALQVQRQLRMLLRQLEQQRRIKLEIANGSDAMT
eukprot:TRINITY_DN6121_c0_g1_i2.p1 TRINITY_DN6121_c0_g1~~TRINITY_DN6121_c0_g1_i2.p1  ORF type:complete len:413 (+),score=32.03 TRINITY_DN6121_c0_g1_i2:52-1290(+)